MLFAGNSECLDSSLDSPVPPVKKSKGRSKKETKTKSKKSRLTILFLTNLFMPNYWLSFSYFQYCFISRGSSVPVVQQSKGRPKKKTKAQSKTSRLTNFFS